MDNIGKGKGGGACTAAAFLKVYDRILKKRNIRKIRTILFICIMNILQEFAPPGDWIHMDIAGVMKSNGEDSLYISRGMSGKPTRALVQLISNLSENP